VTFRGDDLAHPVHRVNVLSHGGDYRLC
jgi:hypothetical protein